MSYILTASSSITTPVSILNGGTGETTAQNAMISLSSPAFENSASSVSWGVLTVAPPVGPPSDAANQAAIVSILEHLQTLEVFA